MVLYFFESGGKKSSMQSHKIGKRNKSLQCKNYERERKKNYLSFIIMCLCFTTPILHFARVYISKRLYLLPNMNYKFSAASPDTALCVCCILRSRTLVDLCHSKTMCNKTSSVSVKYKVSSQIKRNVNTHRFSA